MCDGTRCTHHIDPVVQELEQSYDDWRFEADPIYLTTTPGETRPLSPIAYLIRVRNREGGMWGDDSVFAGGPSHDQAMIRFKDDIGYWYDKTDDEVSKILHCTGCASGTHVCVLCRCSITHMASGICVKCREDIRES